MNWNQEMINRVSADIDGWIKCGKTTDEAIHLTKKDSVAGPAVWEQISINYQSHQK